MTRDSDRTDSPYSRLNYRRLIAWPERIEREWPFLARELAAGPDPSLLDLGCGTGEHARHAAALGFRAVGIDRSQAQIATARDYENEFPPHGPRFVQGDFADLESLTADRFGTAICLGNVLPHLEDEALATTLRATAARLRPGGRLVLQWLNYERILGRDLRHLPVNFRESPGDPDTEIVFLRLMKPDGENHVLFYPTTLTLTPGDDPPIAVEASREVRLHAWRRAEVERALEQCGLEVVAVHGDMTGGEYDAAESTDVVLVARAAS